MFSALVISENEILCHNGIKLVKAEGERLSELNSKEIVTLAVPSSERISSLISEFNEQNDSYYILLKDYSRYDECTSYYYGDICEFASEALAKEIENNDIPDIIMMNDLDLSSYIVNGMFADMKKFADADSQFDLNDIHEYIIDAFTYNDCLYTIPAKTLQYVLFSDEKFDKWDYNDFISAETSGKYKFSLDTLNYRSITTDIFTPYYNEHVDIQNKKCDFDNKEFISLINHLKEVGLTEDKVKEITNYEYKLKRSSIYSVDDYLYGTGKKYEGSTETPYVVGWPSENGGKIIMKPLLSFGITNQSEHKETAWEFVKYVINKANNEPDAVNDGFATDTVPSSVSVTEEYIRTSANRSESNKFTAEDKKQYLSIFTMPVVTDFMYRKVSDIVNSELDEYFYSEDRTAEEVAESIQNKVTQYLNELS